MSWIILLVLDKHSQRCVNRKHLQGRILDGRAYKAENKRYRLEVQAPHLLGPFPRYPFGTRHKGGFEEPIGNQFEVLVSSFVLKLLSNFVFVKCIQPVPVIVYTTAVVSSYLCRLTVSDYAG